MILPTATGRVARALATLTLLATAALAWACADTPTGPSHTAAMRTLLPLDPHATVTVLERTSPLAEDEVVSRTIEPFGGFITLPSAGLVVVVPPGAVRTPTTITVVAPAGNLVGYHFFPERLVFEKPVHVIQDLLRTKAFAGGTSLFEPRSDLVAAYFEGDLAPTVEALEVLPLHLFGGLGLFTIRHFSGYVIATN